MASPEGGVDIESVAEKSPEKIFKVSIDLENGPEEKDGLFLAKGLNLSDSQTLEFINIFKNLSRLFIEKDLALVEINPLVIDANQNLKCLDGKISVDTNSLYRQDDILEMMEINNTMVKTLKEYLSTVTVGGLGLIRPMASLSRKGTDIGPKGSRGRGVGLAASTLPKAKQIDLQDKKKKK